MKKECVLLDGKLIHIGEWDYQVETKLIQEGEYDEETGEQISDPVYENTPLNPLPDGAIIRELEIKQNEDGSLSAIGYEPEKPLSQEEENKRLQKRLASLESSIFALMDMI